MKSSDNLRAKVVKNAAANLIRLAGAGVIALALPPFLVRTLSKDTYAAWALLLQLTVYVGYLDFGIQTAVAKFVAQAEELHDQVQRDRIVNTAFVMLLLAALLACLVIALLAWQLPRLFSQMPAWLYPQAQIGLLFMGCSLALGLPTSVISALFIGFQRNEIPAAIAVATKIATAALVVAAVLDHQGLAIIGIAVATANLLGCAGAFSALRLRGRQVRLHLSLASKACARQITAYSSSVVVWMAAMLMVSGLDLTIVGIFDYKSTAYYAVAATLTNFLAQAQGAIFAALLPASAVLAAREDSRRLGIMLVSSTRYGMLTLLAMALPLILGGHLIISKWAGADYAQHGTAILQLLLVANVVRLCALPYATLLLGTGQQRKAMISPLAEGFTNLTASIVGAYLVGAIGVAIGTLIGALVSVGLHFLYNMPRTAMMSIDRLLLLKDGLVRPVIVTAPLIALLPFHSSMFHLRDETQLYLLSLAMLGTVVLLWHYGLVSSERHKLAQTLRSL